MPYDPNMKYRDLVEGQSELSSRFTMDILQADLDVYDHFMNGIKKHYNEKIPAEVQFRFRKYFGLDGVGEVK